ncbi:MAG TPA: hypothetical protein VFK02_00445, partial [Kofleriaceae bacterium]|nr:hypothetical protein [Kofleriaceae bacterium]
MSTPAPLCETSGAVRVDRARDRAAIEGARARSLGAGSTTFVVGKRDAFVIQRRSWTEIATTSFASTRGSRAGAARSPSWVAHDYLYDHRGAAVNALDRSRHPVPHRAAGLECTWRPDGFFRFKRPRGPRRR